MSVEPETYTATESNVVVVAAVIPNRPVRSRARARWFDPAGRLRRALGIDDASEPDRPDGDCA